MAVAAADGSALVIDRRDDSRVICRGHMGEVNAVNFSRDGALLATGGDDGTARVWRSEDCAPHWRAPLMLRAPARLLTHNGWISLAGNQAGKTPRVGDNVVEASVHGNVTCMRTHQQSTSQVLATPHGCVAIDGGKVSLEGRAMGDEQRARVAAFADKLIWVGYGDRVVGFNEAGVAVERNKTSGKPSALVIMNDRIIVGLEGGGIQTVWRGEPPIRAPLPLRDVPSHGVTRLSVGPRATIVAGFANGAVGIWERNEGALLHRAQLHDRSPTFCTRTATFTSPRLSAIMSATT